MRSITFSPGEWYHCYNRGVDKRLIYLDRYEYKRFQMLLYVANSPDGFALSDFGKKSGGPTLELVLGKARTSTLVDVGAYAMMPNHYHLLLREKTEGGITSFMRKVGTGYTMYFNLKHDRTGVLFSGKFKAKHVGTDRYLRRIVNYIHANPIELFDHNFKRGTVRNTFRLKRSLEQYNYSSYLDYMGTERPENGIVNTQSLQDATDVNLSFDQILQDANDFAKNEVLEVRP